MTKEQKIIQARIAMARHSALNETDSEKRGEKFLAAFAECAPATQRLAIQVAASSRLRMWQQLQLSALLDLAVESKSAKMCGLIRSMLKTLDGFRNNVAFFAKCAEFQLRPDAPNNDEHFEKQLELMALVGDCMEDIDDGSTEIEAEVTEEPK
jgi:hypothetical protein